MWHIGIDLHKQTIVIGAVHDSGQTHDAITLACRDTEAIVAHMQSLRPFRAVVEATAAYRWLYDLLSPYGTVLLAHPLKLRAMIQRRSKTDKLDAMLLANLLRIDQVPLAYIPTEEYHFLRDMTRHRVRLGRAMAHLKTQVRVLLARHNREAAYKTVLGKASQAWLREQAFGPADNWVRDDLLARYECYRRQAAAVDRRLEEIAADYPQVTSLLDIHGIGLYSGLLIVAELGAVERFRDAKQVAAYAGLTARVQQSGGHCYHGHITKQGSSWLRWVLVEAAMKVIRRDERLMNFYQRIRKRSSSKIARVAVARKLAEISWKRLRRWHRAQAA